MGWEVEDGEFELRLGEGGMLQGIKDWWRARATWQKLVAILVLLWVVVSVALIPVFDSRREGTAVASAGIYVMGPGEPNPTFLTEGTGPA
ncbi:MAG: hypothetical protein M3N51_03475, partial [Actinomycetota bacterium]|nr:hypothetical protein [Actinomycetota bacterium]